MKIAALLFALFLNSLASAQKLTTPDTPAEEEILRLLNLERAREGLTSLRSDPVLQQAAREHSRRMANANALSHKFDDEPSYSHRLTQAGAAFSLSAENVAFAATAEGAHKALMNSPGHRKNILTPEYNAVGIGVVRSGDDIWVTQDFIRGYEKLTEQEARNQVIAAFARARRQTRLSPVTVIDEPRLQTHACHMAQSGELDSKTPLAWSARLATTYTEPDLSHLPSTAMKMVEDPAVQRISVGACFARSAKYESGMNFVAIVAY